MQERESKLAKFSFPLLASNFASVFGDGVYRFGLNWFLVSSYGNAQVLGLSLIHISEPTRRTPISYAVFCLKKKKKKRTDDVSPTN